MDQVWANRAESAEAAVTARHLKSLWHLPGTQLGVVAWPPIRRAPHWHYWWQAHLLDCLIDAQLRDPQHERAVRIKRQIRGHWVHNALRWTNQYYDDMAWLALAIQRAERVTGIDRHRALNALTRQLAESWMPEAGGGIPWRKEEPGVAPFLNAPANGPAGIFLARHPDWLARAQAMGDWLDATLIDPETHLVFDGIRSGSMVRAQYTYCQGVVLGLETELAVRTRDPRHAPRVHRLVAAVAEHMAPGGVLKGAGGGDGGLFAGITARYLALVATDLPGESADDDAARATAAKMVLSSAKSAWDYRQSVAGLPLFGAFWDQTAEVPRAEGATARSVGGAVTESEVPERDLSVQLGGWMLMEAAHAVSVATVSS
ncbi:fructose-bisphosphate aldolase [Mycobacterium sp. M1]|uniref:Fructose-bisphosphate aldolase n=1 Tax=Mycolicibacter acidiphilus TaxID=2835306 RepID=A0ABS5RGC6_9MYCO|nr:glycoside hydrolase family 76 protein [Mycolicibacter acidiphilus]MBS9532521.1 fructose-bisphosphate aldolase [Mycolicibacter acidiphilus]